MIVKASLPQAVFLPGAPFVSCPLFEIGSESERIARLRCAFDEHM